MSRTPVSDSSSAGKMMALTQNREEQSTKETSDNEKQTDPSGMAKVLR